MPMPKHLRGKAVDIMKQPNRGKGAGRKPNPIKAWVKEANLNKTEAKAILLDLLTNYTPAQLTELSKSEYSEMPVLPYLFLTQIIAGMKKGDFTVTKQMLEFIFGSESQVNITNNTQLVDLRSLIIQGRDPKEREKIIEGLEAITGNEDRS